MSTRLADGLPLSGGIGDVPDAVPASGNAHHQSRVRLRGCAARRTGENQERAAHQSLGSEGGPPAVLCATSHLGGRPRRGCSSCPSIGSSCRSTRVVTSDGALFPPQSGQRSWSSAIRRNTADPSSWTSTLMTGGQFGATAVPISRLQRMHVMSATKTVVVFLVVVEGEGSSVEP